jgi:CRP-like cAMP-binding protein
MSEKENILQILENVPLFQKLELRQLKHIANQFADRDFEAGQEIVKQGQGGIGLFIVVSGHAQAIRERVDGARVVVNEFGPGDFFGEMSLLDDGPRTASVVATEATRCLVLVAWDFHSFLKNDPAAAILVLQSMAQRFRQVLDAVL